MESSNVEGTLVGWLVALCAGLAVLKLAGVVEWPWVWVLAPLAAGWALLFLAFVIFLSMAGVFVTMDFLVDWWRHR